jgi:hypothetical protein
MWNWKMTQLSVSDIKTLNLGGAWIDVSIYMYMYMNKSILYI